MGRTTPAPALGLPGSIGTALQQKGRQLELQLASAQAPCTHQAAAQAAAVARKPAEAGAAASGRLEAVEAQAVLGRKPLEVVALPATPRAAVRAEAPEGPEVPGGREGRLREGREGRRHPVLEEGTGLPAGPGAPK